MKLTNNQLYIILLLVLIVYLLYNVKTKNYFKQLEHFEKAEQNSNYDNRPQSLKNFQKTSAGHICEDDIDGIYDRGTRSRYKEQPGAFLNTISVTPMYTNIEDAKDSCLNNEQCEAVLENISKNPPTSQGVRNIVRPIEDDYHKKRFKRYVKLPKDNNNLSKFCKKYAGATSINDIAKVLIPSAVKVSKSNFVIYKLSDLPITKIWNGKYIERKRHSIDFTGDTARDNVRRKNGAKELTRDEAKNWCSKHPGCEHVSIARPGTKSAGLAIIEAPQYYGNGRYNKDYDLISKVFEYEFSVAFWIKIDAPHSNWRNILHIGNTDVIRCPSFYIIPNTSAIRVHFCTTERIRIGPPSDFQLPGYKKWTHVTMTFKGQRMIVYINGKEVLSNYWMGHPIMPVESNVYLAYRSYPPDGKFHLSKMNWYPMRLTQDMVHTIAFGTYPLREFDPALSFYKVSGDPTVKFRNQWKGYHGDDSWGDITVNNYGNFTFIDGVISGPKANVAVATLPQSSIPDRNLYFIAYTTGGYLVVKITKKGYVYVLDIDSKEGKISPTKYIKDNPVSLSNIRFLRHSHNYQSVWGGLPFDYGAGFVIMGVRGTKGLHYWVNYRGEVIRPRQPINSRVKLQHKSTYLAPSSDGKPAQIDMTNNGIKIVTSHKHGSLTYADGISWSYWGGEKLKLSNAYLAMGENGPAKVYLNSDGNEKFVNLSGKIIKYYRRPVFKNLKKPLGCYKNDLPNYHGNGQDTYSCAKLALSSGDQFMGLSNRGECRSGSSYGKKGESVDCYMKCDRNPNEKCGGPEENIIYDTSLEPELITYLPVKYRPRRNLTFLCSSGDGVTRVDVRKNGQVLWVGTSLSGNKWFSLNNVCYHI